MPLIYSGQEAANEKRLEFFEKDVIDWKDYPKHDFFTDLIKMKHDNPALWNGNYGGEFIPISSGQNEKLFSFKRVKGDNDILVLLNLSKEEFSVNLETNDLKDYQVVLAKGAEIVNDDGLFSFKPWSYCVLKK